MGSFYDDFKKKQNKSQNKPTLIKVPQVVPKSNDRRATAARNREQQRVQAHVCRAAIKANDRIQSMEIRSLLNELETCENPFTCPHGRPTIVEITKTEIEKMFKRIM